MSKFRKGDTIVRIVPIGTHRPVRKIKEVTATQYIFHGGLGGRSHVYTDKAYTLDECGEIKRLLEEYDLIKN